MIARPASVAALVAVLGLILGLAVGVTGSAQAVDGARSARAARVTTTTAEALAALRVHRAVPDGYDRDLFRHWIDADGDGCDTRDEVLIAENRSKSMKVGSGCTLDGGRWASWYDGVTTNDPSDFDIDHLIPLAEAWASGARGWSSQRREDFANDLDDSRALLAVTASSNRSKGDRDPAGWLPQKHRCRYVSWWIAIKSRWSLKVDRGERRTLARLVDHCGSRTLRYRPA